MNAGYNRSVVFALALLCAFRGALAAEAGGHGSRQGAIVSGQLSGRACGGPGLSTDRIRLLAPVATPFGGDEMYADIAGRAVARVRPDLANGDGRRWTTEAGGILEWIDGDRAARLTGRWSDGCELEAVVVRFDAAAPAPSGDYERLRASYRREIEMSAARARNVAGHPGQALARAWPAVVAATEAQIDVVTALQLLDGAFMALDTGEFERASPLVAKARGYLESVLPATHPAELRARDAGARLMSWRGDLQPAIVEREALDDALEATFAADTPDVFANQIRLLGLRSEANAAEPAFAALEILVTRTTGVLGMTHPITLQGVETLASIAIDLGQPAYAAQMLRDRYGAAVADLGADHWNTVRLLRTLALADVESGELPEALAAAQRAYTWYVAELGETNLETLNTIEFLAYVLKSSGRVGEALEWQVRAEAALRTRLGAGSPRALLAADNLASWYLLEGRAAEARIVLERIVALSVERHGAEHPRTREKLIDLANAWWDSGDPARGCALFDRLAGSVSAAAAATEPQQLDARFGRARCRLRDGNTTAALEEFEQILAVRRAASGADSPASLDALAAVANARLARGDREGARQALAELVERTEVGRSREAVAVGGERAAFARRVRGNEHLAGYRDLAWLHAQAGNTAEAIRVAELARARSINDALALRVDANDPLVPERDRLRLRELESQRRTLDAQTALSPPATAERVRLSVARDAISAEIDRLRAQLARDATPVASAASVQAMATAALEPHAIFVSYQAARGSLWAYVLKRGAQPVIVSLGNLPQVDPMIAVLRNALASDDPRRAPIWKTPDGRYVNALIEPAAGAQRFSSGALAAELAQLLLAPLRAHLAGARHITIAADGALGLLPFEILPFEGARLIATREITYAPSLAVWNSLSRTAEAAHALDLVAFGAPDYARLRGMVPGAGPWAELRWAPLPGAAREVAAVAGSFAAGRRRIFDGADATKANFAAANRSGELRQTRYLHVAANGYLSPAAPQWSAIVLGGDGDVPGYITAAELATYDIGAELVVLSACETALGKDVAGEGLFGLPYALTVAGARATLLTLWPVADASTAAFMQRFYAKLSRGTAPPRALAETKREFLRDPKLRAPFHWAPFVLYGR